MDIDTFLRAWSLFQICLTILVAVFMREKPLNFQPEMSFDSLGIVLKQTISQSSSLFAFDFFALALTAIDMRIMPIYMSDQVSHKLMFILIS